jgi:6-pyruvoyltetrahydropterin/6-carboxytetrahydropterin synthase
MAITLERTYRFSAAHRYYRPEWTEEENRARFGKCANSPGHGHDYRVTLVVGGEVDPLSGFVIDLVELDRVVSERVLDRLDHHQIDASIPEFAPGARIPSCENVALWIRDQLREALPASVELQSVRVAENDDLAATWLGSRDPGA